MYCRSRVTLSQHNSTSAQRSMCTVGVVSHCLNIIQRQHRGAYVFCNNNNILYSSQREIKAVVRSHNEKTYLSNSKSLNTRTYTLLDIRPLFLSLHTLKANPKFPGIMLSLSNQNVKTLKLNKNHQVHTSTTLPQKAFILNRRLDARAHSVNDWYNSH